MMNRRKFLARVSQGLCAAALAVNIELGQLAPVSAFMKEPPISFAWVKELIQGYKTRMGHFPARIFLTQEEWTALTNPDLPWLIYNWDHGNYLDKKNEPFWVEMNPYPYLREEIPGLGIHPTVQADASASDIWVGSSNEVLGGFYPPSDCTSIVLPKDGIDTSLAASYEMPVRIEELTMEALHSKRASEGISKEAPLYWKERFSET